MKLVPKVVGVVGALVVLASVFGRFHRLRTINLGNYEFAASSVLLLGTALMVMAIFLALLSLQEEKR